MKRLITTLTLVLSVIYFASAGEKMSDAQIKQKLLGYWRSPRHDYEYTSDGIMHMLGGTTTSRWDVRSGVYYEGGHPYDIVTFTHNKFVYRDRGNDRASYTLKRITKADAAKD
jgi:hypothetical protein